MFGVDAATVNLWIAGITGVATLAGSAAAFFSWRTARASTRTAEAVAQIERDRWHVELTPKIRIEIDHRWDNDLIRLNVWLDGPDALDGLDGVELRIRNVVDIVSRQDAVGTDAPSAQEIADQVWSIMRFRPGVDQADRLGRTVPARPLRTGDRLLTVVETTPKPWWIRENTAWWSILTPKYTNKIRIEVVCTKHGYRPWHLVREVDLTGPSADL